MSPQKIAVTQLYHTYKKQFDITMLFINLAVANKPGRHYWYNGHLKERRREEKDKEREIEIEREKVWRKKRGSERKY